MNTSACRDHARALATAGIADLARAFNHCHNPAIGHRYADAVQKRFLELAAELVQLVERGEIVSRDGAKAQTDKAFQKLMTTVTSPEVSKPAA